MVYGITTAILLATIAAFFIWARPSVAPFGWKQWLLRALVALPLLVSGIAHFVHTAVFASIMPPVFPYPWQLVRISGLLELAGAVGLFVPRFARAAALCLALLMVAIFPANVFAAHRWVAGLHMPGVPLRLVMQIVYIVMLLVAGWGVRRAAR